MSQSFLNTLSLNLSLLEWLYYNYSHCLSHAILLCDIIEQFISHIGGLLAAIPLLVSACEEFLTPSHDINN